MPRDFTDLCVYTIKHSEDLAARGTSGPFHEKRAWATAKRLLIEAERDGKRLPVVFCPAETTDYLFGWAEIKTIDITPDGTDYTFSKITLFKKKSLRKSRLKLRSGERLSANFIRPYAICQRPGFLEP